MVPQLMSPRLPGVKVLAPDATGPQYARWRREVKSAFTAKGIWGHCDGTRPMPMPESGPNFFSPVTTSNHQPELLEERRAWVKKDRDVKLDIFLSVADDIKLEVFEVGPPLPPSAMTAQDMIRALDERFGSFKFEDYHHVFCHFLNLHIDQYASLADFNAEFATTLEDLMDHGYPLDNLQACSAYFSKLRCTQNPWVSEKLRKWDTLPTAPLLADLMQECPPWMIIRPLTTKASHTSVPESYTEGLMGTPSLKEEGYSSGTERSEGTAPSSSSSTSHSRNPSTQSLKQAASHSRNSSHNFQKVATSHSRDHSAQSQDVSVSHSRTFSQQSQEITVGASVEDLRTLAAFPMPTQQLPKAPRTRARRLSSKDIPQMSLPPINRPLPPLPDASRSNAPQTTKPTAESKQSEPNDPKPTLTLTPPRPQRLSPPPQNESDVHPAFRSNATVHFTASPVSIEQNRPTTSHSTSPPTLAPPFTAGFHQRPASSRGPQSSADYKSSWSMLNQRSSPHLRHDSNDSSIISLPLQGPTFPMPEYRDTVMSGAGNRSVVGLGLGLDSFSTTALVGGGHNYLAASPPKSLMSRFSAELSDDEKRNRKRSWSLKARLSARRLEVKEII